ncbi:MAG TPA: hypothetical protein VFX23_14200 [Limnobacter sp.]|uniref:hypothetical protein n=1 Tax=Limnobacter sp. TaxID=2003368 RepID=UPI002E312C76|nr:hypothetical protein [Limnobacter sp.]HEX5487136.1 hypothetical protein [Limnobacter sp.]
MKRSLVCLLALTPLWSFALSGCAVASATAGAAISVTGAVVSAGVSVAGSAASAAIDAASGSKGD